MGYDRYLSGGPEALGDRSPRPSRAWNRVPEAVREKVKNLALQESELSPRELAVQFTNTEKYFVSEASGCDCATVLHKPRLLTDNGSSCISGELANWLEDRQMDHVRGALYHPQTQGKIEPLPADCFAIACRAMDGTRP